MKVFGMKQREPTDEDRAAVARLSAVAARFKGDQSTDLASLTESAPDPLGQPKSTEDQASAALKPSEEPEAAGNWQPSGIADASEHSQQSDTEA